MASSPIGFPMRRQSTRKRQTPVRFGFDDREAKRQRKEDTTPKLLDLPVELLQRTMSFVATTSDRFSLQTTCKLFRNLSNSAEVVQDMPLLGQELELIQPEDTSELITRRWLPFAKNENKDALYLLGLLAIYVEDDTEAGLALINKGKALGDLRAQFELGTFLRYNSYREGHEEADKQAGGELLEEAAKAGHAPSMIETQNVARNEFARLCKSVREEMASTSCLRHLISKKEVPPAGICGNPCCLRQCYNTNLWRICKWLKRKHKKQLYSTHWKESRGEVMACGIPLPIFQRGKKSLFLVGCLSHCSRCFNVQYCSVTCQTLHWRQHKTVCRAPAAPAAN